MRVLLEIAKFFWDKTKAPLKSMIESEAFILAFSKLPFLPKWCVKVAVKWTLNRTAYPIIDEVYSELGYLIDVQEGKIILKRINDAQTVNDWNNAINSGMQSNNNKKASGRDVR
jgi:hypothetical protein